MAALEREGPETCRSFRLNRSIGVVRLESGPAAANIGASKTTAFEAVPTGGLTVPTT
jgi:hypothetical protein